LACRKGGKRTGPGKKTTARQRPGYKKLRVCLRGKARSTKMVVQKPSTPFSHRARERAGGGGGGECSKGGVSSQKGERPGRKKKERENYQGTKRVGFGKGRGGDLS